MTSSPSEVNHSQSGRRSKSGRWVKTTMGAVAWKRDRSLASQARCSAPTSGLARETLSRAMKWTPRWSNEYERRPEDAAEELATVQPRVVLAGDVVDLRHLEPARDLPEQVHARGVLAAASRCRG